MPRNLHSRLQGDFGELSAIMWLTTAGARVSKPLFHSPDYDLIADFGGTLHRVEVKTSHHYENRRWVVSIATYGGNQSWNGVVKRLDPTRCDYLFAHVGDGRRWFIPAGALAVARAVRLGGPKHAEYEVERGQPLSEVAMGGGGFEPPKAEPTGLQPVPFDRSGIPPGTGGGF